MAQKRKVLKLSRKTKVIPIKRQRNKRVPSPMEYSLETVTRTAETLTTLGFSEVDAYRSLAAQLHADLIKRIKEAK